jgi:hypothetical protein
MDIHKNARLTLQEAHPHVPIVFAEFANAGAKNHGFLSDAVSSLPKRTSPASRLCPS